MPVTVSKTMDSILDLDEPADGNSVVVRDPSEDSRGKHMGHRNMDFVKPSKEKETSPTLGPQDPYSSLELFLEERVRIMPDTSNQEQRRRKNLASSQIEGKRSVTFNPPRYDKNDKRYFGRRGDEDVVLTPSSSMKGAMLPSDTPRQPRPMSYYAGRPALSRGPPPPTYESEGKRSVTFVPPRYDKNDKRYFGRRRDEDVVLTPSSSMKGATLPSDTQRQTRPMSYYAGRPALLQGPPSPTYAISANDNPYSGGSSSDRLAMRFGRTLQPALYMTPSPQVRAHCNRVPYHGKKADEYDDEEDRAEVLSARRLRPIEDDEGYDPWEKRADRTLNQGWQEEAPRGIRLMEERRRVKPGSDSAYGSNSTRSAESEWGDLDEHDGQWRTSDQSTSGITRSAERRPSDPIPEQTDEMGPPRTSKVTVDSAGELNFRTWISPHDEQFLLDGSHHKELFSPLTLSEGTHYQQPLPGDRGVGGPESVGENHVASLVTKVHETTVRRRHKRRGSDGTTDDELLAPLLSREPSPSSSAASSNVDWLHKFTAPSLSSTLVESDGHTDEEQKDAGGASSGSGNNASISGSVSTGKQAASGNSEGLTSANNGSDGISPPPNAPPPSQPPPIPPHDLAEKPTTSRTKRLLNLLSCSEAIMFYIQSIQLCAISFQVACTTIYFMSTPPPLRGTGRFKDSDYMSLLSTCLVQTIALGLSLIGMKRRGDENLWIWTLTVASISCLLSIASLVLYFVYTTFGNLFMCLAAVCQLWIWKFVIFGARDGTKSAGGSVRSASPDTDLEMQQVRTR